MPPRKRLSVFERYLSLWVGLCMVVGVVLGKAVPIFTQALRGLEFGAGSQINVPIAVLIWLMITPMMMKVDFGAIRNVGRRPRGLFVTLVVNWLVKPFSMAAIAWLFFRLIFAPWIAPADANQYIAGCIILAAAPCTAMVFVWSHAITQCDFATADGVERYISRGGVAECSAIAEKVALKVQSLVAHPAI